MKISFLGYVGAGFLIVAYPLLGYFANKFNVQGSDNPIRSGKRSSPAVIAILYSSLILMILAMTLPGNIANYRRLCQIQQHGQLSEANVDSIYRRCGRHGCSLYVQYHYSASTPGQGRIVQAAGEAYIGPERPDNGLFIYAQSTGHVPIAYDLNNVQSSALNFDNSALSGYQAHQVVSKMETLVAILAFVFGGGFLFLFATSVFRRKNVTA